MRYVSLGLVGESKYKTFIYDLMYVMYMEIRTVQSRLREPFVKVEGKLPRGGSRKACVKCKKFPYNRIRIVLQEGKITRVVNVCVDCILSVFGTSIIPYKTNKITKRARDHFNMKLNCDLCSRDKIASSAVGGIHIQEEDVDRYVKGYNICVSCVLKRLRANV